MFEAFAVAVRLRLIDAVTPGLRVVALGMKQLAGDTADTEKKLKTLEDRLTGIKRQLVGGGIAAGVGAWGLSLFDKPLQAARDYELAFTKFKTLNLGDAVNKQADQFARGAQLMGISAKDLMETMSESVGLFGSFTEAQKMAPKIAQLNQANAAIFGGKVDTIDEGAARSLMKFIDRRGGTKDEASFERNLNLAEKLVTGSGGFIKFRDLDTFSQQGGTAFRGLSDEGILNMASLLQEQGGSRAGTALMSLYQNLVGGRTPKKTMAMLQEFGLGHLTMQEHATVGGKSLRSLVMTDVKDAGLLQSDPASWMRSVFLPALAARGITDQAGILRATNDLLSNRTASGQASIMTTQLMQVMRDASLAKNAMGADQVLGDWRNDPNSKFADLTARWTDTLRELGTTVLPLAITSVEKLNTVLKVVADFARDWPNTTKTMVELFGVIAAATTIGGTVSMATAGFRALTLAIGTAQAGGLAGALGVAGPLAAGFAFAIGGGAIVGSLIYNMIEGTKAADWFGRKVAQVLGVLGDKDAQAMVDREDDLARGGPIHLTAAQEARLKAPAVIAALGGMDRDFKTKSNAPTWDSWAGLDTIRPQRSVSVSVSTQLVADGRKLAEVVTKHQAKAAAAPNTGINGFDGKMQLTQAGGLQGG